MTDILNAIVQIALFILLIGLIYAIVQIVDVIREEKDLLTWYRQIKAPVRTEDDQSDAP